MMDINSHPFESGPHRTRSFLLPKAPFAQGITDQRPPVTDQIPAQDEPRIFEETGMDARITSIIAPSAAQLGFRLVRVRVSAQNGQTLQIFAERPDGTMTVADCEALSRAISPILDVEDPLSGNYHLEVSSPGIDRPMVRKSDFMAWQGHVLKFETDYEIDGRRRFKGTITDVTDEGFTLMRDKATYGDAPSLVVPFGAINFARLVLTDELIEAALKRDKAARKARGLRDHIEIDEMDAVELEEGEPNDQALENDNDNAEGDGASSKD